jgi:raffinose/stachyose/melibiose transport system permease protein
VAPQRAELGAVKGLVPAVQLRDEPAARSVDAASPPRRAAFWTKARLSALAALLLQSGAAWPALGASRPQAPTTLDIPVFAGGFGTDFYVRAAREFERLRPGVHVNVYGDPRVHDQIRVRVMDGHYPDAACAAYVLWPALIRAGKIIDLDAALQQPDWDGRAPWRSRFMPGALENWVVDGKVYGLPVSYSCWTIFYNRRLFRARGWPEPDPSHPWTWAQFFALCDRIRAAGIAPVSIPGTRWLYADAFFRSAYYNLAGPKGWPALADLTPGARSDPRVARAAAIEQRVTTQYAQRGWQGETHTGAELAFIEGRAAMTVSGSWLSNEMGDRIPPDFELGAMNFPVFADGAADPTAIQVSTDSFFVFHTGDPARQALTLSFLKFLTSHREALAFVREFDSPAAVRGVPLSAYSPRMRATAEMIARAHSAFPMWQVMLQPTYTRQALIDQSNLLTSGAIAPDVFARNLEAAAAQDRAAAAHPDQVDDLHPVRAMALLAVVAGLIAVTFWRTKAKVEGASSPSQKRRDAASTAPRLRSGPGAVFVFPSLALYAAFVLAPALIAFGWAFTRWDGISQRQWVGTYNFRYFLVGTDVFWQALAHNLFLMVVPAALIVPVAVAAAAFLHRGVPGARFFRAVILFPNLLGGIAAILIWLTAYAPHGGLVNAGLTAIGLRRFENFPWLSNAHLYLALIPLYLWMACGFNLILYLAAMEGIDPQLYEAAALDGASGLRQFFTITLPLIRDVLVISAVFLVIAGLNAFEMIWLLTEQDPSAEVHTLATLLVTTLFKDFAVGRSAALAVLLFLLVFAVSGVLLRWLRREADE